MQKNEKYKRFKFLTTRHKHCKKKKKTVILNNKTYAERNVGDAFSFPKELASLLSNIYLITLIEGC